MEAPEFEHGREGDPRARLRDADPHAVARGIVLQQLTMAPRSRAELQAKLDAKQVPVDVAHSVLDRMEELDLVDDRAFAQAWVRSRQAGRGLSRRALSQELYRKGIDGEVAATALETVDDADERETARRLVDRRLKSTNGLDRVTRTRRLAGMLARKGYPGGLVQQVVREALEAEGAEPADEEASAVFPQS